MILAFCWLSRLDLCLVSHVETCSGNSAGSRRCCVTSPGSRVGITAVDAAGSAMLWLWHGLGLLQMVGFKARVQQTGFQVNLACVGGRVARAGREFRSTKERERTRTRCFKQSDLDTAHRRLVESECLHGAEPHPCPWCLPSLHFFM